MPAIPNFFHEGNLAVISGKTGKIITKVGDTDAGLVYLDAYVTGDWDENDEIRDLDTGKTLYYIHEGMVYFNNTDD